MVRPRTLACATLAVALLSSISLAGVASPAVAAGGTVYVDAAWALTAPGADPDGGGPATSFGTDSFATVASALAALPARIELGPGVYVEQVEITADVEIVGQGIGVTTIQDSATYAPYFNRHSIVLVRNAATAKLSNLSIAGPNTNPGGILFAGVFVVESATATLDGVEVSTIRNEPLNGAQTGVGILVGDVPNSSTGTAVLTGVTVTDSHSLTMDH